MLASVIRLQAAAFEVCRELEAEELPLLQGQAIAIEILARDLLEALRELDIRDTRSDNGTQRGETTPQGDSERVRASIWQTS